MQTKKHATKGWLSRAERDFKFHTGLKQKAKKYRGMIQLLMNICFMKCLQIYSSYISTLIL